MKVTHSVVGVSAMILLFAPVIYGQDLPKYRQFSFGTSVADLSKQIDAKPPKEDLVKALPKGQYIKHYRYGFGVITDSNDEITSIDFEARGSKNFVTSLMVVELSDLTPPMRFRAKWVKTVSAPGPLRKAASRKSAPNTAKAASAAEPAEETKRGYRVAAGSEDKNILSI